MTSERSKMSDLESNLSDPLGLAMRQTMSNSRAEDWLLEYVCGNVLIDSFRVYRAIDKEHAAKYGWTEPLLQEKSFRPGQLPPARLEITLLGLDIHLVGFVSSYIEHVFNRFHCVAHGVGTYSEEAIEKLRKYISSAPLPVRLRDDQWEDLKMVLQIRGCGRPEKVFPSSGPILTRLERFAERHGLTIEDHRFRLSEDDVLKLLKMADSIVDGLLDVPIEHFWSCPDLVEDRKREKRSCGGGLKVWRQKRSLRIERLALEHLPDFWL